MADTAEVVEPVDTQVEDQKMDQVSEVVEELDYAVTETAGEGGVIENLESIAVSLSATLARGGSLDATGFEMYNCAMRSNLRRIGIDHTQTLPSIESYEDPITRRGATKIALEGVFSAIGEGLKKVWDWIVGLFKKIGEFFGFGKKAAEKQEEKKVDIVAELKKLDAGKKIKLELDPGQLKNLAINGKVEKNLDVIVSDYANMSALANHDAVLMTDQIFKLFDNSKGLFDEAVHKKLPEMIQLLSKDPAAGKAFAEKYIGELKTVAMMQGVEFLQAVGKLKGDATKVRNVKSEKYEFLAAGKLGPDSPAASGDVKVAVLAGGLEVGFASGDLSQLPKQAMKEIKEATGGLDLSFMSKLASLVFVRTQPIHEFSQEGSLELSVGEIIKLNEGFSAVIKDTLIDSEYDKKVSQYVGKLSSLSDWVIKISEEVSKVMDTVGHDDAKEAAAGIRAAQAMLRSLSSVLIDLYRKVLLCVKDFNAHALKINGTFVHMGQIALKAA